MNDWLLTSKEVFLKDLKTLNLEKLTASLIKGVINFLNHFLNFLFFKEINNF